MLVSGQFVAVKFVATKFVATNSPWFKFAASQIRRESNSPQV
jgi:hypothetical protein